MSGVQEYKASLLRFLQLFKIMENIFSNQSQFQKILDDDNITNSAKCHQFLYYLKKNTFLEETFMMELDSFQLSPLHYIDCLSFTTKNSHVGLFWYHTVVIHMNFQYG